MPPKKAIGVPKDTLDKLYPSVRSILGDAVAEEFEAACSTNLPAMVIAHVQRATSSEAIVQCVWEAIFNSPKFTGASIPYHHAGTKFCDPTVVRQQKRFDGVHLRACVCVCACVCMCK